MVGPHSVAWSRIVSPMSPTYSMIASLISLIRIISSPGDQITSEIIWSPSDNIRDTIRDHTTNVKPTLMNKYHIISVHIACYIYYRSLGIKLFKLWHLPLTLVNWQSIRQVLLSDQEFCLRCSESLIDTSINLSTGLRKFNQAFKIRNLST